MITLSVFSVMAVAVISKKARIRRELEQVWPAAMMPRAYRSRRRVIRERNERGFLCFLQTLKSVLRLLVNQDGLKLTTEEIVDTRSRLVDAAGTLLMLENDLTKGNTNFTELPAEAVRVPVQKLRHLVIASINQLCAEIEKSDNIDFYDEVDTAYSTSLKATQGPGRKPYDILKDQVQHLCSPFISWTKIAALLQVSV